MVQVSVLIPVYNRELYIEQCLLSAMRQTFTDLEIVVSDNASTDGTVSRVECLAATDPRVRLLRNASNLGPVRNWLRCAEAARGELVLLLFSDDWLEPSFLEVTTRQLADPAVSLAYTAVCIHGLAGESDQVSAFGNESTGLLSGMTFARGVLGLEVTPFKYPVSPCCALLRRADLLEGLKEASEIPTREHPYDHAIGPDLYLLCRAALSRPSVYHDARALVHFRAHPGSISVASSTSGKYNACYGTAAATLTRRYMPPGVAWELAARLSRLWLSQALAGDPFGFCAALNALLARREALDPRVLATAVPSVARLALGRVRLRLARGALMP